MKDLYRRIVDAVYAKGYDVMLVPTGLTRKNMPVGMQIVAPSFETETAMQFAYAYAHGAPKFFRGDLFPIYKEVD